MRHERPVRTDPFPDRRTVEAARDGDAGAVERLTAGALPPVHHVIGRAAESDLDVDDIVQDTIVAVIRCRSCGTPRGSAPGWWPSRSASSPTPGGGRRATATQTAPDVAGDEASGLAAQGGSEPLAETGDTDPVLPLSIAAGVLTAGAGLLVLARRRRS
ncbi:LPXTG cell wall anchor domain-containing protein [Streptomyces koyangensis]